MAQAGWASLTMGECLRTLAETVSDDRTLDVLMQRFNLRAAQVRNRVMWSSDQAAPVELVHAVQAFLMGRTGRQIELSRIDEEGRTLKLVSGEAIFDSQVEVADQLVEGLLTRVGLSCLYGASNCGKTFLAMDLACSIARGVDWLDTYRVAGGAVLYLACEAPRSVRLRLYAYMQQIGAPVPRIYIAPQPINLFDGALHTQMVIDTAHRVEDMTGEPIRLVVGDTLAALTPGANENHGEDMQLVIGNALSIVERLDTQLLLVHHSGKDDAKGMRGWSGMRAALDTEAEVVADDTGARSVEFTKQRDLVSKGKKIVFELHGIELNAQDNFGNPSTSAVVTTSQKPPPERKNGHGGTGSGTVGRPRLADALVMGALAGQSLTRVDLAKRFNGTPSQRTIYRAVNDLIAAGKVADNGGLLRLAPTSGPRDAA
jgi:putative DNA primase/helicase